MFEQHRPLRIAKSNIEVSQEQFAVRRAGFPKSKDSYRNFKLQRHDISAGLTDDLVLFYEVKNKQFKLVNYETATIIECFPVNIQQTDSEFQMHYFKRSSTLCLVQKLTAQNRLRLHYFKVNIKEEQVYLEAQPAQHPFFPQYHLSYVNDEGTIGWCGIVKQTLSIKLYNQGSEFRQINADLTKLNPIFERDTFKVLRIWQHENLLYVAISPIEDQQISYDQNYSPFLVFNHKVQGECPVQFSSLKIMETMIESSITSCIKVEDYCVIQTGKTKDTYQIFIYDKQLQQILLEEKVPTNNFQGVYYNNMIAGSLEKEKGLTQIIQIKIIRENYLPYQKILQVIEIAEASSKQIKNAILILGEDKTGKSMTRHFLAGGKLIHVQNEESGFYEIIVNEEQMKKEAIDDREKAPWMNITESTAIIDVPNWDQKGQFFKAQIMILFARLFKIYSNIQVLITIPLQYIEESFKNEKFFRTVLEIFGDQEGVEDFISIMLTKVDSVEENLQSFQERIEQITQINEDVGNRIKKISEQGRIFCFENREINEGQGQEMLNTLLSFNKLSFNREKTLSPEQALSESSPAIDLILYESEFYVRMVNVYLLKVAHQASPNLFNYIDNIIRSHVSHTALEKLQYKANGSELAATLIKILAKMKKILTKTQEQNFQNINELKNLLLQLVQQQTGQQKTDDYYFHQIIFAFISVMKNSLVLPIQRTSGKKSTSFSTFITIFETQSDGILGKNIKQIITTFQSFQSVTSLPQFKDFAVKGGPKIKRVTRVQMTYEQEKKDLQKKKVSLEDICKLPSNALKLDLILDELNKIKDKPIDPQNLKLINFYLRQSSKICQYHKLYYQSIYFLFVIPDFYGIEQLIDEFVQHKKRNHSYESKTFLDREESDLVQRLLTLSRQCVRDNLVRKLINLRSLSAQTSTKPSKIRSDELKNMKTYLSNSESLKRYKERLEKKDTTFFYQLKDSDFLKVLSQKQNIIKKCQQFQEEKNTKKKYEDKEALRYILDNVPIPA